MENLLAGASRKIAQRLANGGRVVIGTNEPIDEGVTLGKDGERHLVVKRRATRQEFIENSPVITPEDRAAVAAMHPPFYYELELWDRVLEAPDGFRLGIRIRQVGEASE
jgi:hypothetical protein